MYQFLSFIPLSKDRILIDRISLQNIYRKNLYIVAFFIDRTIQTAHNIYKIINLINIYKYLQNIY